MEHGGSALLGAVVGGTGAAGRWGMICWILSGIVGLVVYCAGFAAGFAAGRGRLGARAERREAGR